jgi:hypothetical protein
MWVDIEDTFWRGEESIIVGFLHKSKMCARDRASKHQGWQKVKNNPLRVDSAAGSYAPFSTLMSTSFLFSISARAADVGFSFASFNGGFKSIFAKVLQKFFCVVVDKTRS